MLRVGGTACGGGAWLQPGTSREERAETSRVRRRCLAPGPSYGPACLAHLRRETNPTPKTVIPSERSEPRDLGGWLEVGGCLEPIPQIPPLGRFAPSVGMTEMGRPIRGGRVRRRCRLAGRGGVPHKRLSSERSEPRVCGLRWEVPRPRPSARCFGRDDRVVASRARDRKAITSEAPKTQNSKLKTQN